MKTVWKFPIPIALTFELQIPQDERLLCIQMQPEPTHHELS